VQGGQNHINEPPHALRPKVALPDEPIQSEDDRQEEQEFRGVEEHGIEKSSAIATNVHLSRVGCVLLISSRENR